MGWFRTARSRLLSFLLLPGTASPQSSTLSLHDALPISRANRILVITGAGILTSLGIPDFRSSQGFRSEEHTSELQSRFDLVCRLLREKRNASFDDATLATAVPCRFGRYLVRVGSSPVLH